MNGNGVGSSRDVTGREGDAEAVATNSDKMDAVVRAVHAQLGPPPHDLDRVMGSDYGYDEARMQGLLLAVAHALHAIGYDFDTTSIALDDAVGMTLGQLIMAIFHATR